ncbi:AAA family ATPase [Mycobacterium sp. B14F4]|uniref:AAA family ATPase n=1 Tax=Mycobacterium sp. B14F4 TaxID=3153565 RepID=UPI00325C655B
MKDHNDAVLGKERAEFHAAQHRRNADRFGVPGAEGIIDAPRNGWHPDDTVRGSLDKHDPGPEPPDDTESLWPSTEPGNIDLLADMRDGEWLDEQEFPPLEWAVQGMLPEGYGLIVAPPKKGKSWLVADFGLACAAGGVALGKLKVEKRAVLYLALEDGDRRLQSRFRQIMGPGKRIPRGMHRITKADRRVILGMIEQFLAEHLDDVHPPLVVLDTLGRAKPPRPAGADVYQNEYDFGVSLKSLADAVPGSTVLAVHHTNKSRTEDFVDAVSGSNAVAGAADFVLVLERPRQEPTGILHVTGRDVPEAEYAMTSVDGAWQLDGTDLSAAADTAVKRHVQERENRHGDRTLWVLRYVQKEGTVTNAQVQQALNLSRHDTGQYLARLADNDLIEKVSRGVWRSLRGPEDSEDTEDNPGQGMFSMSSLRTTEDNEVRTTEDD